MIRKGRNYLPEEVLPYIEIKTGIRDKEFDGDMVHMDSQRYIVFNNNLKCQHCGIEGKYFVKESNDYKKEEKDRIYHFNLYGIDENGEEVLMTKDHIIPKSKGGKNTISNYQTMCVHCNMKKGNKI